METAWKLLDDKTLVEMTLTGQHGCFEILMDRHLGVIRRRIQSMISSIAEAEDVMQEVQLKTWTHLASFQFHSSFRTWLTRIAINEALQYHRRTRGRCKENDFELDGLAGSTDSPYQAYVRQETIGTVRTAIRGLPGKFREILMVRDLGELSIQEAARHLNDTPQAVKTRLFRARIMLSKALQASGKTRGLAARTAIAA